MLLLAHALYIGTVPVSVTMAHAITVELLAECVGLWAYAIVGTLQIMRRRRQ